MNNIFKSLKALCVVCMVFLSACETTDLDLTSNPNGLRFADANTDLFINAIQVDFGILIASLEVEASETVRILNMDGRVYQQAFEPSRFDNEWREAYHQILNDIRTMQPLAEEAKQFYHLGMAEVLEAYMMVTLVDFFGNVPYSEAIKGLENLNPKVDNAKDIYSASLSLLDNAIANFDKDPQTTPPTDLFYGGNWDNWTKAAKSIKMKIYVTTRLVDETAATKFDEIVKSGDYINDISEDFEFPWAISNVNPDARHPQYVTDYTTAGANTYQSNWFMNYMLRSKVDNGNAVFEEPDPRMKYYFYRQVRSVPQDNPNLINCVEETPPSHYSGSVFCSLPDGYWGRDHGDPDGIPPDGQLRTAYGVYPVGGRFDDNSFQVIASINLGAGGAGITPIMLSSWTGFMIAEMALVGGRHSEAKEALTEAVSKSFTKVRSFGPLDVSADLSQSPPVALDEAYITELGQLFDAAKTDVDKMDLLGSEYFVALFGNGIDGRNFYLRTGRPSTLQPNLEKETVTGPFFTTFFYPAEASERNSSITQKSKLDVPPFWAPDVKLEAN